jgi:hypothetical protein
VSENAARFHGASLNGPLPLPLPQRLSVLAILLCLFALPTHALDLKLWPLFDYHGDASGRRSVHLLGPLLNYERQGESIDCVSFDFGIGDGFQVFCMGQDDIDTE